MCRTLSQIGSQIEALECGNVMIVELTGGPLVPGGPVLPSEPLDPCKK